MFDFLFVKYDVTPINTLISIIVGLAIIDVLKYCYKRFHTYVSYVKPMKIIANVFHEISLEISVLSDWARGFNYYTLDEHSNVLPIQEGSVVKIESKDFPDRSRLLPSDSTVGDMAMVLSINYIHTEGKWALIRVRKYKHQLDIKHGALNAI